MLIEHQNRILRYQPFGPSKFEDLENLVKMENLPMDESLRVLRSLSQELHGDSQQRFAGSPVITGRRGCGKTAFAFSRAYSLEGQISHDGRQIVKSMIVAIPNWEALEILCVEIDKILRDRGVMVPQRCALIWEFAIYAAAMQHTRNFIFKNTVDDDEEALLTGTIREKIEEIDDFLSRIEVEEASNTADAMRMAAVHYNESGPLAESFRAARNALNNYLKEAGYTVTVIIDEFDFACDKFPNNTFQHVTSGLLQYLREYELPLIRPVNAVCCIPAEMYPLAIRYHGNPGAVPTRHRLHWTCDRLVEILAERYAKHLRYWHPARYLNAKDPFEKHYEDSSPVDFLDKQFPPRITNDSENWQSDTDFPENSRPAPIAGERPLNYVLRHTMLSPGHVIVILNAIWRRIPHQRSWIEEDEKSVIIEGLKEGVETIVERILSVYRTARPNAIQYCENILPRLSSTFTRKQLEDVYKKIKAYLVPQPGPGVDLFPDVLETLVEIGAVGQITSPVKQGIAYALFEYSVEDRLKIPPDNLMCIHPLFAAKYALPPYRVSQRGGVGERAGEMPGLDEREPVDRKTVIVPHQMPTR